MDDADLQAALGDVLSPDAAAEDAAAAESSLLDVFELDAPADDSAPEGEADEADPLAAQADESEEPESPEEDDAAALRAELAELRQAKRDAEARAAEEQAKAYWANEKAQVDRRIWQASQWFAANYEAAYDKDAFVAEHMPRLIAAAAADMASFKDTQIRAVWDIARAHGSQTYIQQLQAHYGLTADDVRDIAEFSPEEMEKAARLIARTRVPITQELSSTKGQLTKAQKQLKRTHLAGVPAPGSGRAAVTSLADIRDRITSEKADDQLGAVLRLVGAV